MTDLTFPMEARRDWKNGKATIWVSFTAPDGTKVSTKMGGNRAARASAVWAVVHGCGEQQRVVYETGCLADVGRADALVRKYREGYTRRDYDYHHPPRHANYVLLTD